MRQSYAYFIFIFLSISSCVGEETKKKIEFDLSDFIDRANPLIVTAILENNLDPLHLPNITKSIALSTVNITNAYLHDLSKIQRNKAAILTYQNKELIFHTGMEIKDVTLDADYYLKRIWTQRNGKVYAYASPLHVEVGMHFDLRNFNFTLTTLNVNNINKIQVKLTGNDNSDWIVNIITNAATSILKKSIQKTVASEISVIIQSFLDKIGPGCLDYML